MLLSASNYFFFLSNFQPPLSSNETISACAEILIPFPKLHFQITGRAQLYASANNFSPQGEITVNAIITFSHYFLFFLVTELLKIPCKLNHPSKYRFYDDSNLFKMFI